MSPFTLADVHAKAHHRYTLQILTGYKYTKWMCNVAHRTFTPLARVSASGRKSSRQRACATMHTSVLLSLLVFLPMDENFHDNVKCGAQIVQPRLCILWIIQDLSG